MPAISVLIKPASGLCNMHCDYCFYKDEMENRTDASFGFMTEETLKNVIRKTLLRAEGVASYAFQGGEPSLRGLDFFKKAVELQKKYNKNNVRVNNAFQTNGTLIDEAWCAFFKENNFLVGLSIDGNRCTHDKYRHLNGKSAYDKAYETAKLFDKFGVEYNVLTVVTADVAKNIEEIYRDYAEKGFKYQQYIPCLEAFTEDAKNGEFALTPEVYGEFLIKLFDLWFEDWKKGRQPYIRSFENYVGILMGYMPEACEQRGVCGIQNTVEADGSVYPCDFYALDEYKLGNFNTDNLDVINENRLKSKFIERSIPLPESCKACQYIQVCRGGCMRNRVKNEFTGDYENRFCLSYKMFFDKCLDRMWEIV